MLPEWYSAWVKSHLVQFSLVSADTVATFGSWWQSFSALGFTPDELTRATRHVRNLPAETSPKYAGDHYHAIKLAVVNERDRNSQKAVNYDDSRGLCDDCGDSGFISVPHPKFCNAMTWRPERHNHAGNPVYVTAAVVCRCWKGRKFAERQQADEMDGIPPKTMTIGQYEEKINGDWRRQIRERDEQRRTVAHVEAGMTGASTKDLISRMAAQYATGGIRC